METYRFPCGCEYEVVGPPPREGAMPLLNFNSQNLPDCKATWELLARGDTKGLFQLESSLGQTWTKALKPEMYDHIAALGALLRPGALKSVDAEGVSMTQHYCRRKNLEEEVASYHPVVDEVLKDTYGTLIYQESAMALARKVAGFNLMEADALRKCVTGDTHFVSRTRGWVTIDRLMKEGYSDDDFFVMNERGQWCWKKIEKIWSTGTHNVREVKASSGMSVKATKHHQFLTSNGWKARSRLTTEDFLICTRWVDYDGADTYSPDLAMVIAGVLTEGHFVKGRSATFVNHDTKMMTTFAQHFKGFFGSPPNLSSNGRVARFTRSQTAELAKYMTYGLSGDKYIPDPMMGLTKETTRHFLSFMLAAEGGVSGKMGSFEFSSKSLRMTKQVQLLLLRFGVRSYILSHTIKEYGLYYRLYINDRVEQTHLLRELTEHWPEYKKDALLKAWSRKTADNYTSDTFPPDMVRRMLDQYHYAANYEGGSAYRKPLSRNRFARLALRTNDPHWELLPLGRQSYDQVRAMDEVTRQVETFDFTVEGGDTPYIVANGLVIHNSIGKKLPELMAQCKKMFLEGAEKTKIVSTNQAEEIFGWIEKSQRYSFNASHSVSYGLLGYDTAYIKTHFPHAFYYAWLRYAKDKVNPLDEIHALVNDARLHDVPVEPPDLRTRHAHFHTDGVRVVFGLSDIKGVGGSVVQSLLRAVEEGEKTAAIPLDKMGWLDFLLFVAPRLGESVLTKLVRVGALRWMGVDRKRMTHELMLFNRLTQKEMEWLGQRYLPARQAGGPLLPELLRALARPKKEGGGVARKDRIETVLSVAQCLENPPTGLTDSPAEIAGHEASLLGIAVSCSLVDACDASDVNCSCKDYLAGRSGYLLLGVKIEDYRVIKTKRGQNPGREMAFLTVSDSSGFLNDVVVFPEEWATYRHLLLKSNTVLLKGERDNNKGAFKVNRAWQMREVL